MKYFITILGLTIIVLRTIGVDIDITSIGLFIFVSFILLIKDFGGLKKISGFGVKVEFDKELKKLATDTEKLEEEIQEKKTKKGLNGPPDNVDHFEEDLDFTTEEDFIIQVDMRSPKLALLSLAIEIEKTLKEILVKHFGDDLTRPISAQRMADKIFNKIKTQGNIKETFNEFWKLRNAIIHSDEKVPHDKIISLIDSGLRILKVLKTVDRNLENSVSMLD